jgi:hypothetical protein
MTLMLDPARVAERSDSLPEPAPGVQTVTSSAPPTVERAMPAPAVRRRSRIGLRRGVLTVPLARLAGLVSLLAFIAAVQVEPVANGPAPALAWWDAVLLTVTQVALLASWIMLAVGRRSGLRAGVVAWLALVTQSALCPAVGHHVIAPWWWAQLGIAVSVTVLGVGLLAATRAAPPSTT